METKPFLEIKNALTEKMFKAIGEMKARAKDSKLIQIQRMYGVVLGLRLVLMELNTLHGQEPTSFGGALGVNQLIADKFGQKTLKEIREYVFPEF
jgi:hypothetical protein